MTEFVRQLEAAIGEALGSVRAELQQQWRAEFDALKRELAQNRGGAADLRSEAEGLFALDLPNWRTKVSDQ